MGVSGAQISYSNSTLNTELENKNNDYDSTSHVFETITEFSTDEQWIWILPILLEIFIEYLPSVLYWSITFDSKPRISCSLTLEKST